MDIVFSFILVGAIIYVAINGIIISRRKDNIPNKKGCEDIQKGYNVDVVKKDVSSQKKEIKQETPKRIRERVMGKKVDSILSSYTNIINLLWIADGEYANYDYDFDDVDVLEVGDAQIRIFYKTSKDEPSLIYTTLPIQIPKTITAKDKIGYYPSYENLSPEERYIYLNWLKNPFEKADIDIGYVFIFYYGLERYLYLKKSKEAFKAILRLLSLYKDNHSFYNYSYDALLYFCIVTKDQQGINTLLKMEKRIYSDIVLYAKYVSKIPIYVKEIIELANFSNFNNKRYINLHRDLFETTLTEIMRKTLGTCELFLDEYARELKTSYFNPVANHSLLDRPVEIISFSSSNTLKDTIYNLLFQTHNEVKEKLKELRKNKSNLKSDALTK